MMSASKKTQATRVGLPRLPRSNQLQSKVPTLCEHSQSRLQLRSIYRGQKLGVLMPAHCQSPPSQLECLADHGEDVSRQLYTTVSVSVDTGNTATLNMRYHIICGTVVVGFTVRSRSDVHVTTWFLSSAWSLIAPRRVRRSAPAQLSALNAS